MSEYVLKDVLNLTELENEDNTQKWYPCSYEFKNSDGTVVQTLNGIRAQITTYTSGTTWTEFHVDITSNVEQSSPSFGKIYRYLISGTLPPHIQFTNGWQPYEYLYEEMNTKHFYNVSTEYPEVLQWLYSQSTQASGQIIIVKSPTNGGTVTGDGSYAIGDSYTVTATPNVAQGYRFQGWYDLDDVLITTESSYTNVLHSQTLTLVASFVLAGRTIITLENSPGGASTLTGAGEYQIGTTATLGTSANLGYDFQYWKNKVTGETVSYAEEFTFPIPMTGSLPNYIFVAVYYKNEYAPTTDPSDLPSSTVVDTKASNWMVHGDTGMYCIFIPTKAQLGTLASWLYSQSFWDVVNSFFQQGVLDVDLSQIVISLMVIPMSIASAGTKNIKVGWFAPSASTGTISMNYTNDNYVTLDCGSVTVNGIYNGFLDYETNAEIYLPFIGYKSLETYDVVNKTIKPVYQIDILTGECICKIYVDGSVKYQFTGCCGYSIPLSQVNCNGIISKGVNAAIDCGLAIAGVPLQHTTSTISGSKTKINRSRKTGNVTSINKEATSIERITKPDTTRTIAENIGTFMNLGNGVAKGGALQGNAGYLGVGRPYLNITRPHVDIPNNFGKLNGYPCNKELNLGNLSGFTVVDEIQLKGFECTNDELGEIEDLLKEGVIL